MCGHIIIKQQHVSGTNRNAVVSLRVHVRIRRNNYPECFGNRRNIFSVVHFITTEKKIFRTSTWMLEF